ncbi:hypothetical protein GJV80_15695 [Microlunatus sp. Gsoil 973]|nr:hypothetical protein GJV80_15695 [Microlunatus sp. Gsoil 973]
MSVASKAGAMLVSAAALLLLLGQPAQAAQPKTSGSQQLINSRSAVQPVRGLSVSPSAITRFCSYTGSQPLLRYGSSGTAVRQAQCEINWTIHAGLAQDGSFGPKTLAAVKKVQSCAHIAVDGIIGPNTWSVLNYYNASPYWLC